MQIKINNAENREWRDIPGYEGLYQVSNYGEVRSLPRITRNGTHIKGRMMRMAKTKKDRGYYFLGLSKDGRVKYHTVHKLVALAFIGPRMDGMEVDHINEDVTDNRAENLRYLSPLDNKSRSNKGRFRKKTGNAMGCNPRAKRVISTDGIVSFSCAKYLTVLYGINYSTLREKLREDGFIEINNRCYRYEYNYQ